MRYEQHDEIHNETYYPDGFTEDELREEEDLSHDERTIRFIKKRVRILVNEARTLPETAAMVRSYLSQLIKWAAYRRNADLITFILEQENSILGVAV